MHIDTLYPNPTRHSGYLYLMTTRHHGAGRPTTSRWSLAPADEFRVFDDGDLNRIVDSKGKIYGVLKVGDELQSIGTWQQQVAVFYPPSPPGHWHGHPLFPVRAAIAGNLKRQRMEPSKTVMDLFVTSKLITPVQRRRMANGSHL